MDLMLKKYICIKIPPLACLFLITALPSFAQHQHMITGTVVNKFTQEPLAFSSVYWKMAGVGCLTDSLGKFSIKLGKKPSDTLLISYVGYTTMRLPSHEIEDKGDLVIRLESAMKEGVEVKAKYNKGLLWWRNIVAHKGKNAPRHYDTWYCELYNKIEIDLANIDKTSLERSRILKPFSFVLKDIDTTTEERPFLPVFLTESVSDYYVSSRPPKLKEEIKALQTSGIRNESVMEYLGGIHQKIDVYSDYMNVFGREFISPVSIVGDKYYHYKGLDTQFIGGEKYLHLRFTPKREGENLFAGDCWIHSSSWALQKISLSVSGTANINFVNRLSIIQEFSRRNNEEWMVARDKFIVELAPLGRNKPSFIGRKTMLYRHVKVNLPFITEKLNGNKKKEEVVVLDSATKQVSAYWQAERPELLSKNEQYALTLADTLRSLPEFKWLSNTATFLLDGHKKFGMVEIGPWYKWISRNPVEGTRFRFDIGTTPEFNKQWRLHGYLAYGMKDKAWKGKAAVSYHLPGSQGWNIQSSYKYDLDNRQRGFNGEEVSLDNIFGQLIRRPGIPQKFLREEEIKLMVTKTFPNSLSLQAAMIRSDFDTFDPLPPRKLYTLENNHITSTEFFIKARYAPGESVIHSHRKDRKLRGRQPAIELAYTFAPSGVFGSMYNYRKLSASVAQRFRIPRWGQLSYMVYGGRILGDQLPFMLLQMHPGNEHYYYNKEAFSLMNKYEFFSDRYAGLSLEHNFEKKLLNFLPFMRKSNMRQFWNIKSVIGNLSPENRAFNRMEYAVYGMRSLNGKPYTEIGTGIDNICRFFRVDAVWRFYPHTISNAQNFGVLGSFRLQF